MKSKKNQRSSTKTKKNLSKSSKKYNLVYMAKPPYGGWVSFTAHLSKKFDYDLYKIGNKTENKKRPYGYDVEYQNVDIDTLLKKPNLLITAIDKKYYEYLPKIKKATIVIHDPTELKEPVLEVLKRFKVITIRETVSKLLKEKYNVNNTFLHHPFYEFYQKKITAPKTKALALSRVDFDKHTDMIIEANNLNRSGMNVEIYGALNDLYVYHKLRHTNFKKYYKGKFPKEFSALVKLLEPCKFLVDMSAIKGDGGGSTGGGGDGGGGGSSPAETLGGTQEATQEEPSPQKNPEPPTPEARAEQEDATALAEQEAALAAEAERLADAEAALKRGLAHPSHQQHSYLSRSRYQEQLTRFEALFGADQLLVMRSEALFDQPQWAWEELLQFLELEAHPMPVSELRYGGDGEAAAVAPALRQQLYERLATTRRWLDQR